MCIRDSLRPLSARKFPFLFFVPSEATTTQKPCFLIVFCTVSKNSFSLKIISGNKIICGGFFLFSFAKADDAAIHPACLPITSKIKTFVDVAHIDATSSPASSVDIAVYFATEPSWAEIN